MKSTTLCMATLFVSFCSVNFLYGGSCTGDCQDGLSRCHVQMPPQGSCIIERDNYNVICTSYWEDGTQFDMTIEYCFLFSECNPLWDPLCDGYYPFPV
jgi:hypothetical protein